MSDEIELASKSFGEAVGALIEASGVLRPVQQLSDYLTTRIYYRQLPTVARVATLAAEKIQRLGLPHASVDDPTVLRILEASASARDESMHERWANLLANAVATPSAAHHAAYARMLAEIEPSEAAFLDSIADSPIFAEVPLTRRISAAQLTDGGVSTSGVDNLIRVGILRQEEPSDPTWEEIGKRHSQIPNLRFTAQGWAFVQACRTPQPDG